MSKPTTGPFEKTAGWLDWYAGPSTPRFQLPPAASMRTATSSAPAPSSPTRRNASTRPRRQQGAAVCCATTWLRAQRRRAGHLPRRRQPRHARCLHRQRRQGRAAWPGAGSVSDAPSCSRCTRPACAACASTSSSAWSTSRPGRADGDRRAFAPLAGAWSSTSRRWTRPSCGTSSPRCPPPWSSTTWAGLT